MNVYDLERFFNLVDKNQPSGCWMWTGATDVFGYAKFSLDGVNRRATVVIFEHQFGPTSLDVLHKCTNKNCVNPEHLYAGTHSDNMRQRAVENTNPLQKITVEQVMEIKKRITNGEKLKSIASSYGVSLSLISAIKVGKRWGWIKAYGSS